MRALPAGTSIALVSSGLGARRRCRRLAREAGVELVREFIAMPSVDPPTCYVEESRAALRYFFTQLLALPRGGAVKSVGLVAINGIARVFVPAGLVGSAAPFRIVLGRIPNRVVASSLLELRGMQMLVVALSKDPNAKVTVLLIPIGSERPSLAIKIPTTAAAEATIAAEPRVAACIQPHGCRCGLPSGGGMAREVSERQRRAAQSSRHGQWHKRAPAPALRGRLAAG